MTLIKAMRRRNEALHSVKAPNHSRSQSSQEPVLEDNDDVFAKLEKRYLSDSASSSTDTDDESQIVTPPYYHRAMTDPLAERKHFFNDEAFPTLPRYPDSESNCWSEPCHEIYSVRGENYLQDSQKVQSGPYLLRARGCDLLLSPQGCAPPKNVGRYSQVLGGTLRSLPTFIFKFRLPWGVLPLYFEIPFHLCVYLRPNPPPLDETLSPSERALALFFTGNESYKNSTLKLIPFIPEGPWIARNMVSGKPAIIGNKLPVTYTYVPASDGNAEYLEADLDIGSSSATAKRIVSVCRRYMSALTIDIGLVIQGNSPQELPEQMLGSIRLHGIDPQKAPVLE